MTPLAPDPRLTARIAELERQVAGLLRMTVAPPLSISRGAGGLLALRVLPDGTQVKWARITDHFGSNRYAGVGAELFLRSGGNANNPDDYQFRDINPPVKYDGTAGGLGFIYRVLSSNYDEIPLPPALPYIRAGQYVPVVESEQSPGRWLTPAPGSELDFIFERWVKACAKCVDAGGGNFVIRFQWAVDLLEVMARDLRVFRRPPSTPERNIEADQPNLDPAAGGGQLVGQGGQAASRAAVRQVLPRGSVTIKRGV